MLQPFATALVIMGVIAAFGGVAAWFGLSGGWKRT
jgi:type IV secretory pathway VirB2 component (pilin)